MESLWKRSRLYALAAHLLECSRKASFVPGWVLETFSSEAPFWTMLVQCLTAQWINIVIFHHYRGDDGKMTGFW